MPCDADVIVVGAGAAGCVVARRLADAGRDVLVLDAGPDTTRLAAAPPTILPLDAADPRSSTFVADGYSVVRGVGAGGSAQLNGALWCPPPEDVAASWPGDLPRRFARGLARAEATMRPRSVAPSAVARALAAELGAECIPARLAIDGSGARRTPWNAYRPDLAGARIRFGSPVAELQLERADSGAGPAPRVVGARVGDASVRAREVVLCAGAIGSARIVQRTARSAARLLAPATRDRLARVGTAACEHPEWIVDVPAAFRQVADARFGGSPPAGLLTARIPLESVGGRCEVRPYALPFSAAIPGVPAAALQVGIALLTPRTRIRVGTETIEFPGRLDPADEQALDAATTRVEEALGRGGDGNLGRGRHHAWSQHLYGTVPIGAVADSRGAIPGLAGLHLADASLLPPGLGAGPYAATIALAETIAEGLTGTSPAAGVRPKCQN